MSGCMTQVWAVDPERTWLPSGRISAFECRSPQMSWSWCLSGATGNGKASTERQEAAHSWQTCLLWAKEWAEEQKGYKHFSSHTFWRTPTLTLLVITKYCLSLPTECWAHSGAMVLFRVASGQSRSETCYPNSTRKHFTSLSLFKHTPYAHDWFPRDENSAWGLANTINARIKGSSRHAQLKRVFQQSLEESFWCNSLKRVGRKMT